MRQNRVRQMTRIALFAALVSVSSYVIVPLPFSPVPITLQTFMIILSGLLLAPTEAGLSLLIFLLLGAIGLPVYSGGGAGLAKLFGPTGGYLFGFMAGAFVTSLLRGTEISFARMLTAAIVGGVIVVYAFGIPWLSLSTGMDLKAAFTAGALPFLIGDAFKVALAVIIAVPVRKQLKHIL